MNSIFLLNSGAATEQDHPIIEAHFNLWMVGTERFLDIGLKLEPNREVELYLPWEDAVLEDLYEKMKQSDVLNAIFNQHLAVATSTNFSWITVTCGAERFDVMEADCKYSNVKLKNTADNSTCTKITIKPKYTSNLVAYVRLRAKSFPSDVFDEEHSATGAFLSPHRETIEAIDFRVNEIRTVQPAEFGKGTFKTPEIKKLHFFLLKSFQVTNLLSSPQYDRCRELEDKAWEKYLPTLNKKNGGTLAYHWKKSNINAGEHFSVLATFGEKKTSWWIVLLYVGVIILLNLLSSSLYDLFPHSKDTSDNNEQPSIAKKLKD